MVRGIKSGISQLLESLPLPHRPVEAAIKTWRIGVQERPVRHAGRCVRGNGGPMAQIGRGLEDQRVARLSTSHSQARFVGTRSTGSDSLPGKTKLVVEMLDHRGAKWRWPEITKVLRCRIPSRTSGVLPVAAIATCVRSRGWTVSGRSDCHPVARARDGI